MSEAASGAASSAAALGAWESFVSGSSDAVSTSVVVLLLLMSVCAWVLIFWKSWVLRRARRGIARAVPAFWQAEGLEEARSRLDAFDREGVLGPLVDAALEQPRPGSLESSAGHDAQLTRRLRDALHRVLRPLQFGQVLLASIGATAPFVGLLGTVWGIYHALVGMAASRAITVEQLAGPVGEALVMTAAGLVVAIPAVLAYNAFGKLVGHCEAELEGFAQDLLGMAGAWPRQDLPAPPPADQAHGIRPA